MPRAPRSGITEGQESPTVWWPTLSCPIVPCAPHTHLLQTLTLCRLPAAVSRHGLGQTGKVSAPLETAGDGQSQGIQSLALVLGSQGARPLAEASLPPSPHLSRTLSTTWRSDEERQVPRGEGLCQGSRHYKAPKPPFEPGSALPTAQVFLREALPRHNVGLLRGHQGTSELNQTMSPPHTAPRPPEAPESPHLTGEPGP